MRERHPSVLSTSQASLPAAGAVALHPKVAWCPARLRPDPSLCHPPRWLEREEGAGTPPSPEAKFKVRAALSLVSTPSASAEPSSPAWEETGRPSRPRHVTASFSPTVPSGAV